jgi:hypothetical protein
MSLQVPDLYDPRTQWASYIINAIKAKELFVKDVNYIVKNNEVSGQGIHPFLRQKVQSMGHYVAMHLVWC